MILAPSASPAGLPPPATGRRRGAACRRGRPRGTPSRASARPRAGATGRPRRRAPQLLRERPGAELELRLRRQRAAPEGEPARLAARAPPPRGRRAAARRRAPSPSRPRRRRSVARSSCTSRRLASPESHRRPGTTTAPSRRDRRLVGDKRPPLRRPRRARPRSGRAASHASRSSTSTPAAPQQLDPSARLGVRVARPDHDPRHPLGDHALGAGRRRALVRARLERHVERRAARRRPGRVERDDLRMAAARLGHALGDDDRRPASRPRRPSVSGRHGPPLPRQARARARGSREGLYQAQAAPGRSSSPASPPGRRPSSAAAACAVRPAASIALAAGERAPSRAGLRHRR